MLVRFWGTRGSLAKPGPTTVRYGGNTSCVEVRLADGTLIVLDCGTGAHALGQALQSPCAGPLRGHLLITHTHWDHIQGFPFFQPLFVPGNEWDLYAPGSGGQQLETTLAGQMEYTYFPVTLEQLDAIIRFHDLVESQFSIGRARVVAQYLNHPALTLGYRLESDGVTVVYVADHEPHAREASPASSTAGGPLHREDQRHVAFLAGADLVIHDAQYTAEEYPKRIGWGHSPAEWAVDYALAAGARRLALFHHDPSRDDDAVDRLVETCRERVVAVGGSLDVFGAAEGQALEVTAGEVTTPYPVSPGVAALEAPQKQGPLTVLVADDDPTIVALLTATLRQDGFRVLSAGDGEAALRMARAGRPALILLDWRMPALEGVEVTRALRSDADPYLRSVPIVLLTGETGSENTAAGFAAGVTDYLIKPFKPPFVRARVRAWLVRGGAPTVTGT